VPQTSIVAFSTGTRKLLLPITVLTHTFILARVWRIKLLTQVKARSPQTKIQMLFADTNCDFTALRNEYIINRTSNVV